jgi:lipoate synthase
MTKQKPEKKRSRGKPLGTRQKEGLYTKILELLQQDKDRKGDGYTAFAVSSHLGETHQTVQQYLGDLVIQKKVRSRKISNMLLFSIK